MAEQPWRNDTRNDHPQLLSGLIACPVCQQPFMPVGRQQVCSAACRQKQWRQRHPRPLPVLPARPVKVETVYVCGSCETRYLGEQWCPDCQRPCHRLGPSGLCPHCEEPAALSDLLPDQKGGEADRRR